MTQRSVLPALVIFDLDGTLAKSKSPVTPGMGELISALLEKTQVAVMSGGSWKQFQKQLLPVLKETTNFHALHLLPVSGAQYYKYRDGAWVLSYEKAFSPLEKQRIFSVLHTALKENGLEPAKEKLWGERIEDRHAQITFSGLGQEAPLKEKERWDPEKKKREPVARMLKEKLPDMSVRVNAASSIDITKKGIDKAFGVRELSHRLSIPIEKMLYAGDSLFPGGNDEIVKETGIKTQPVKDPNETALLIQTLLTSALLH